jgi:hypothetical protein
MGRVLRECFGGDPHQMLKAAKHFMQHGRPPMDLGVPYREALGSRARRPWWQSVLNRLCELDVRQENETFNVDSISGLRAAWGAVSRGETVLLSENNKVFGKVSPLNFKKLER